MTDIAAEPILPTAAEAREHPCLWAMHCAGVATVEGVEAQRMSAPSGSRVPRWRPAKHLWYIGDLLMGIFDGTLPRLILSLPPRHGKSHLASRAFAGFYLGRRPHHEVIIASYGDRLPRGWSKRAKSDLVSHGQAVFGVEAFERASAIQWAPVVGGEETEGQLLATSSGGTITGAGAHLLILDDMFKGVAECRSKARRDEVWEWVIDEALTRLAPGGAVLCIGTRWHPDDVIGRLLDARRQAGGEEVTAVPWKYVALPALAEGDDDPIGRAKGEALWPERFPVKALLQKKAERDPRSWASLYQCRPVKVGGEFFKQKWLRYWTLDGPNCVLQDGTRIPLSDLYTYITCDLAVSTKDKSDYSVIASWGISKSRKSELLLLDVIRERLEGPEIIPRIRGAIERWGAVGAWIEKTNFHTHLIQHARSQGMLIGELKPDTDKKTRAIPATMLAEGGQLYFRAGADWLPEFEDELLSFPEANIHDDCVDVMSYAAQLFADVTREAPAEPPEPEEFDADAWDLGFREQGWV